MDQIDSFAQIAGQYLSLVERHPSMQRQEFLRELHRFLPELYMAGVRLPFEPELDPKEGLEAEGLSTDAWSDLYRSLSALIGNRNIYHHVFDPYELADEALVGGRLADDIADIYRDLLQGAQLYQSGHRVAAAWEWRFHFDSHWGVHLTAALRALHSLAEKEGFDFSRRDV